MLRFPTLLLLLVTIIWGVGFLVTKDALVELQPMSFIAIRFLVGMVSFLLFSSISRECFHFKANKSEWFAGSVLGTLLFAAYGFQTYGLVFTDVTHTAFITGLSVIFVPIILVTCFRQSISRWAVFSILLSVCGMYLLSGVQNFTPNKGDLLVLICAIACGFHIVMIGRYTNRYPAMKLAFIQITICAVLSSVYSIAFEKFTFSSFNISFTAWAEVVYCGVLATSLAFLIQTNAQRTLSPVRTSLILICEPVVGTICAYFLLGERLNGLQTLGCGLMLSSFLLAELAPLFSKAPAPTEEMVAAAIASELAVTLVASADVAEKQSS